VQTNTDEVSRTSLALRAAESAKGQRQDRDSVVSTESTSDSVRTSVRGSLSPGSSDPTALTGNEITRVSTHLFLADF